MSELSTKFSKRCKKCGEEREISLFKYKLTKAQARAQGYAGNFLVELEGKTCNLCKRKPKPLVKKTKAELMRMVDNGDLSSIVFDTLIKERQEKAQYNRSQAMHRYYATQRAEQWFTYLIELRKEIRLVTNAIYSADKRDDHDSKAFNTYYLTVLRGVQAGFALIEHMDVPNVPWITYAKREFTHPRNNLVDNLKTLKEKWDNLPMGKRMKMRQPTILFK
jgi:hypothetical protein